jgi:hypothetical protein
MKIGVMKGGEIYSFWENDHAWEDRLNHSATRNRKPKKKIVISQEAGSASL